MKSEPYYKTNASKGFDVKAWILKLLFSKAGQFIAAGVAAVVGFIVTFSATYLGFYIDAELQTQLIGVISTAVYALINFLLHKYAGDNVKALQQALKIDDDRWIGPETVAAAARAAHYASKPEIMPDK